MPPQVPLEFTYYGIYLTCTVRGSCSGPEVNKNSSADDSTYWNTLSAAETLVDVDLYTKRSPFSMYWSPLRNAARQL